MEAIFLKEYVSERRFEFFDATKSGWFLFRSPVSMHELPDKSSIHLILAGARYLEFPVHLYGIRITKPRDEQAIKYHELYDARSLTEPGQRVYAIESEGRRYNCVAADLWVHEHSKPMYESSLPGLERLGVLNKDYFNDHVKAWYRID